MGAKFYTYDGGYEYAMSLNNAHMGNVFAEDVKNNLCVNFQTMDSDKTIVCPNPGADDVEIVKRRGKDVLIGFNVKGMMVVFEEDGEDLDTIAANADYDGADEDAKNYMFCEADVIKVLPGQLKAKIWYEDADGEEVHKTVWINFRAIDVIEGVDVEEEDDDEDDDSEEGSTEIIGQARPAKSTPATKTTTVTIQDPV